MASEHGMPVTQARAELADLVNRVAYTGERVTLTRHGRVVAGLVSAEDLQRLAELDRPARPLGRIGFAPPARGGEADRSPGRDVAARAEPPSTEPGE